MNLTRFAFRSDERVVICFRAPCAGGAVAWKDEAVWRNVFKRTTDVFECNAIGFGCGAAADGSCKERVTGDHDGVLQAVDVIAECGNRMA